MSQDLQAPAPGPGVARLLRILELRRRYEALAGAYELEKQLMPRVSPETLRRWLQEAEAILAEITAIEDELLAEICTAPGQDA